MCNKVATFYLSLSHSHHVVSRSSNREWNQTFSFLIYPYFKNLYFKVDRSNRFGDIVLGRDQPRVPGIPQSSPLLCGFLTCYYCIWLFSLVQYECTYHGLGRLLLSSTKIDLNHLLRWLLSKPLTKWKHSWFPLTDMRHSTHHIRLHYGVVHQGLFQVRRNLHCQQRGHHHLGPGMRHLLGGLHGLLRSHSRERLRSHYGALKNLVCL